MQEKKPHIGRFIDPLSDFGFKFLFGSDPHKEMLIAFLNELFEGRKHITALTYNKNENNGPQFGFRKSIFDLTCTGRDGEQFIIEVQRIHQHYFKDRAIYYSSALIHDQGPKGETKWDYKLKAVYVIGLMDFSFPNSNPHSAIHRIHLVDEATGKIFYEKLGYVFVEIPKFNKTEEALETDLDRWLFVLKNMSNLEKIPVILNKRIFEKLFKIAEVSNLTKEDYMLYEKSLMAEWDEYAIIKSAEQRGELRGELKGELKGEQKGEQKKSREIVQNLLATNRFTNAEIANFASVTEGFVYEVQKSL